MNQYKEEWLRHSLLHQIHQISKSDRHHLETQMGTQDAGELGVAMAKTGRALFLGAMIAQIDGPLPVMDVVGLGIAASMAGIAWFEYFS
jgi:hypothetical protein